MTRRAARALWSFAKRAWPYVLVPLAAWLVYTHFLLEETQGRLCPTLDDAFIHYQYARSIAEGHPLAYHPGDNPTTGATSLSYVLVLAVGWAIGFRGMAMTLFAHLVAVVCLAIGGWAAKRMGDGLIGAPAGTACAAVVWAFPQLVFMAFGGMELALVVAAQLLAVGAAVRWCTAPRGQRTAKRAFGVALLGGLAALTRPEAITGAAAVAFALFAVGSTRPWTRLLGVVALAPGALPGLIARATTGVGRTNGQIVKWLYADPYMSFWDAWDQTWVNVDELIEELFTGTHADHAVPLGFNYLVALGAALTLVGAVRRHGLRGLAAYLCFLAGVAGIAVPTTYWTFDTNLGRYLWPFVPIAAMAAVMGAVVLGRWLGPRLHARTAPVALAAAVVVLCVARPKRSLDRIVDSASEICDQHLVMVEHVRALPEDAVLAVNDAGAFAYLTRHRTYDLVGLTTPGAARAWANGKGAVFEQLEHVPTWRRPRFMAFYPTWLQRLPIGGERIAHVHLPDASHVGGADMELRRVRTELFHSGDRPALVDPPGHLVAELDVADVTSEEEHAYELELARRPECWLKVMPLPGGDPLGDGGRLQRTDERFVLEARPGTAATWVFRTDRRSDCRIALRWNGEPLPPVTVERGPGWAEHVVEVPADRVRERNEVERRCRSEDGVGVYHDWLYQP